MRPEAWSDRLAATSFWALNIGLAWMAFCNLFPVGIVQLYDAVRVGYWHACDASFIATPWVHALEWLRLPGDAVFIVGGALPLLMLCFRSILNPNPSRASGEIPPDCSL